MGAGTGDHGNERSHWFFRDGVADAVEYLQYEARLQKKTAGSADADHLDVAARKGVGVAQELLDAIPEYPQWVEYLIEWARQLFGRSGIGFGGAMPLSPTVLKDWAEMKGVAPLHPLEFEALLELEMALHYNEEEPASNDNGNLQKKPRRPWPTKEKQ